MVVHQRRRGERVRQEGERNGGEIPVGREKRKRHRREIAASSLGCPGPHGSEKNEGEKRESGKTISVGSRLVRRVERGAIRVFPQPQTPPWHSGTSRSTRNPFSPSSLSVSSHPSLPPPPLGLAATAPPPFLAVSHQPTRESKRESHVLFEKERSEKRERRATRSLSPTHLSNSSPPSRSSSSRDRRVSQGRVATEREAKNKSLSPPPLIPSSLLLLSPPPNSAPPSRSRGERVLAVVVARKKRETRSEEGRRSGMRVRVRKKGETSLSFSLLSSTALLPSSSHQPKGVGGRERALQREKEGVGAAVTVVTGWCSSKGTWRTLRRRSLLSLFSSPLPSLAAEFRPSPAVK